MPASEATTATFSGEAESFWAGLKARFPGESDSQILLRLKAYIGVTSQLRAAWNKSVRGVSVSIDSSKGVPELEFK